MTKRLTKEQRTERKCLVCAEIFTPKKGASKGLYCQKECSSKANGYGVNRRKFGIPYEMNTPEEAIIYYEDSLDKEPL